MRTRGCGSPGPAACSSTLEVNRPKLAKAVVLLSQRGPSVQHPDFTGSHTSASRGGWATSRSEILGNPKLQPTHRSQPQFPPLLTGIWQEAFPFPKKKKKKNHKYSKAVLSGDPF